MPRGGGKQKPISTMGTYYIGKSTKEVMTAREWWSLQATQKLKRAFDYFFIKKHIKEETLDYWRSKHKIESWHMAQKEAKVSLLSH